MLGEIFPKVGVNIIKNVNGQQTCETYCRKEY